MIKRSWYAFIRPASSVCGPTGWKTTWKRIPRKTLSGSAIFSKKRQLRLSISQRIKPGPYDNNHSLQNCGTSIRAARLQQRAVFFLHELTVIIKTYIRNIHPFTDRGPENYNSHRVQAMEPFTSGCLCFERQAACTRLRQGLYGNKGISCSVWFCPK